MSIKNLDETMSLVYIDITKFSQLEELMTAVLLTHPTQSANVATALVKGRNGKKITLSVSNGNGKSSTFNFEIGAKRAPIDVQGQLKNAGVGTMFRVELSPQGTELVQILPNM